MKPNDEPTSTQSLRGPADQAARNRYWRSNLRIVTSLLAIWFVVAYLISIVGIETFNQFKIGRLGLGFWFAQQGSIVVFVLLVGAYALLMDRLDRRFQAERRV